MPSYRQATNPGLYHGGRLPPNAGITLGLYWDCIRVILGLYWDCVRVILGVYWDCVRAILGLYWDCGYIRDILRLFWDSIGVIFQISHVKHLTVGSTKKRFTSSAATRSSICCNNVGQAHVSCSLNS